VLKRVKIIDEKMRTRLLQLQKARREERPMHTLAPRFSLVGFLWCGQRREESSIYDFFFYLLLKTKKFIILENHYSH